MTELEEARRKVDECFNELELTMKDLIALFDKDQTPEPRFTFWGKVRNWFRKENKDGGDLQS